MMIGELVSYRPNEFIWQEVASGSFSNINLQIVDQESRPVKIRDPNILINVLFRVKNSN